MDWEVGQIFYSQQEQPAERAKDSGSIDNVTAKSRFRAFLHDFHVEHGVFTYRDQLLRRYRRKDYQLQVRMQDLMAADNELANAFREAPMRLIPLFEAAIKEALTMSLGLAPAAAAAEGDEDDGPGADSDVPNFQLVVTSDQDATLIRDITAAQVNRLLVVPGIIINASRARPQATGLVIRCRNCNHTKVIAISNPFQTVSPPRTCEANLLAQAAPNPAADEQRCPIDPYVIEPDRSSYVDHQTLKLQEAPEDVPTGEMPRHVMLSVNRQLVDLVKPGTRVRVVGVSSVFTPKAARGSGMSVRRSFLKVVGIQVMGQGAGGAMATFTKAEEQEFRRMAADRDVYGHIWRSVAPAVSGGYTEDIKKAIACLLVGGSRRVLPDGMRLRGDINVLMLGDPSTAKSQFLKFVEKVAPVGVYTSGKGSSAAGLTASVTRDSRGEFYLEGGAMVLADGGVVCIDEFDKMREEDRVAIHEAMEQQTISVAKAGITTILNARSAVLAAANPVFGRYDDRHSPAENIDFLPTILSRFDLIFIVRDIRDEERDKAIAEHVMSLHFAENRLAEANDGVDVALLRKYISYCRQRCAPCLTAEASTQLAQEYVKIREGQRKRQNEMDASSSTIPITVRQLEAVVRVSEALAKLQLSHEVTPDHVKEAVRLFKASTLSAARAGSFAGGESGMTAEQLKEVRTVEDNIKRRVSMGSHVSVRSIVDEFMRRGHREVVVRKALEVMVRRGEFKHEQRQRYLLRQR